MASITQYTAKSGQFLKGHSPEIMAIGGVAVIVTAGVLAARATLKLESAISIFENNRGKLHTDHEAGVIDDKELKKALFHEQLRFVATLGKLYGIPVTMGVAGIGLMLGGQNVLKKRNVALVGAYSGLEQAYKEYRKRVVDAVGEEREAEIRLNLRAFDAEEGEGSEDTKSAAELTEDEKRKVALGASEYAVIFDAHTSPFWSPNPDISSAHLRSQQNYANDRLVSRGYLFLNEIFEALGMPKTKAGQFVGWTYDPKYNEGDNFVDFGLDNMENIRRGASIFDEDGHFLLDFNVEGVIVDKVWGK